MNEALMQSVSELEIKKTVDNLGALKAPSPDGLNGMFYQKHWDVIKGYVCLAVTNFFQHGVLPLEVNETVVTLIPKIPIPESINHLCPISCCNFIYKVISKIVVLWLKGFMNDLISPNQSAFVGGRLIQDNLLIAHEVFHDLKGRGSTGKSSATIKVDMSKAYDRVDWVFFLKKALASYGFCDGWVNLIMKLVTTVSYKYKVNGFLSFSLMPHCGLRKGNPLSPYLFILVADVLSHMLTRAQEHENIQGIWVGTPGPAITHLFFVDDALLFAQASREETFQLFSILNHYSKASGQKINVSKSGLICGKFVNPQLKHNLAIIMNMSLWESPRKYLCLPGEWGRSKCNALAWIKERIM